MKIFLGLFIFILFFMPNFVLAGVVINEIMYDLEDSDKDREWIEIYNDSSESVDLTDWRFNDGSNHLLNEPPKNGGQGDLVINPGEYIIFAEDAAVFLSEHSGFSNTVIDTVMSLGQQADRNYSLQIKNTEGTIVDEVVYSISLGANGDGNSLQKVGGNWIAYVTTPGVQNNSGTSGVPATSDVDPTPTPTPVPDSDSGSGWPEYVPPEERPKIKVYAGEDMVAVVGALAEFRGMAYDYSDEPLEGNARYLWNFGDGTTKEGKNVSHYYSHPGEYRAVLNVTSGKDTASGYLIVKVVPGEIYISKVKFGVDGFIVLQNKSSYEINISGWMLRYGTQAFSFPQDSFIMPQNSLTIPEFNSSITLDNDDLEIELLYSSGIIADTFSSSATPVPSPFNLGTSDITEIETSKPRATKEPEKKIKTTPFVKDAQQEKLPAQAGVITVGSPTPHDNIWNYIFIVSGLAVLASLGLFVIRRNSRV